MPTVYTVDVQSGKTTEFKDFAMRCSRAFGAFFELLDYPVDAQIPYEIEPSDYYARRLVSAESKLAALGAMTDDEVRAAAEKHNTDAATHFQKHMAEFREQRARCETMLEKALAWIPPTEDHAGLRTFMIDQLRSSIDFDCPYVPEEPKRMTATEWLNREHNELTESVVRWRKKDAEEREQAVRLTAWIKALRASLEQPS